MPVSEREAEIIDAAVAGPAPGAATWWRLWIWDELSTFSELGWDAAGDVRGMALRARVAQDRGFSDRSALGQEVALEIVVAGVAVERFTGTLSSAEPAKTRSGSAGAVGGWDVVAATRGDSLAEKALGEYTSWDSAPPHDVVRHALGRAGYTGPVRVEEVEEPPITAKEQYAFSATSSVDEELAAVEAAVPALETWDVPGDGHDAFLATAPEEISEPDFVFDASRLEGFAPRREEPRVAWVAVRRQVEPPDPLGDPWKELVRLPVPGSAADEDTVEWIDSDDRSADAVENALQACRDRVAELTNPAPVSFTGPEHPLLVRGSGIWVRERGADALGAFVRTWGVYLRTLSGALPKKRTRYEGPCALVSEVREIRREEPQPPATPGVVEVSGRGAPPAVLAGDVRTLEEMGDLTIEEFSP